MANVRRNVGGTAVRAARRRPRPRGGQGLASDRVAGEELVRLLGQILAAWWVAVRFVAWKLVRMAELLEAEGVAFVYQHAAAKGHCTIMKSGGGRRDVRVEPCGGAVQPARQR